MNNNTSENKEKKLQKFSNILLAVALVFFIFGTGYRLGESNYKKQLNSDPAVNASDSTLLQAKEEIDLNLFWKVYSILKLKYADQDKLNKAQLLYGAIRGMVASLEDPYTFFLSPKENQNSKDDLGGKYEGIGAELGLKDNKVVVVTPLDNSPAQKAGLRPGDVIISIDDLPVKGLILTEVVAKIRGPHDTTVELGIVRNNDSLKIRIKRAQINIKQIKLEFKKRIAYLKVLQFGDQTNAEWDKAILQVKDKWSKREIKGLIVDVRGNPGGYLESSVYLSSEFIPVNRVVIRQEYADKSGKEYKVQRTGLLMDIPLVVLINEGSASASEIFSGAMRDYGRAKLVGKKSFGKGSIQEALDIDKGAGLHVTIAKWILPKGDWINSKGIKPDYEVEIKLEDGNTLTDKTDTQLSKAIELLVN